MGNSFREIQLEMNLRAYYFLSLDKYFPMRIPIITVRYICPKTARKIARVLAIGDIGRMSPYPVVVNVTKLKYKYW